MAPSTAFAFMAAGLALALKVWHPRRIGKAAVPAAEFFAFLVFGLGAEGVIGHISHIAAAHNWFQQVSIAPQTACALMVLGIGLMGLSAPANMARVPLWVPALFCFAALAIDMCTPRGMASALVYVPLVLCSRWYKRDTTPFVFAGIATVLGMLAVFAKPPSTLDPLITLVNRTLTLGTVWFTAAVAFNSTRAAQALHKSESQLRAAVDHAVDGLITFTPAGTIEAFNPACTRLFGYQANEILGQNIIQLIPDMEGHAKPVPGDEIAQTTDDLTARRKDGAIFPIDLSLSSYHLEDGRHFAVVIRDISARKTVEENLLSYNHALERSNKDLDDFAYIASHDLKEPLRGLFNNARFVQEDYADKLDEAGAKRLMRMGYLCQRMEQLINDLLYFSRLGRQELAIQPADLNAMIRDIELTLETTLAEANARIVVPHALPTIICDRTRITEVFRNLVSNAVKYNNTAQKLIEIGCIERGRTKSGAESQVLFVRDNGIGIAEEFYDEVFRIFKRLNAEDESKKGTGVGLTFVRKIIERHSGEIWLDSVPGQGTTFYFTIKQGAGYDAAEAA
jgi:PAS domain S-box-containing protein